MKFNLDLEIDTANPLQAIETVLDTVTELRTAKLTREQVANRSLRQIMDDETARLRQDVIQTFQMKSSSPGL